MSCILVEKKRVYVTHVHGRRSKHVTTADSAYFQQLRIRQRTSEELGSKRANDKRS